MRLNVTYVFVGIPSTTTISIDCWVTSFGFKVWRPAVVPGYPQLTVKLYWLFDIAYPPESMSTWLDYRVASAMSVSGRVTQLRCVSGLDW